MNVSPRLRGKRLVEFCHRLGVQLEAGVDVRRIFKREADSASGAVGRSFAKVRDEVGAGEALSLALARQGKLLPRLCLEMIRVGDETGSLSEVCRRLSRHYQHRHELQRHFLSLIAWPALQLGIALLVVGILIWVLGIVAGRSSGPPIDILGWGLIGTRGLVIYVNFLIAAGLLLGGLVLAVRRGLLWTRPLQRLVVSLPLIGPCVEKLCLAQLCWALHLTLNVAMDLRRLVPLVLRATGNDYYMRHSAAMVEDISNGLPLHVAFANTGAFPHHFLDAMEVGDNAGQLVEAAERLSRHYQEEAEAATRRLAVLAGMAVWALVATLIIVLIFRIFGFYVGAIQDAAGI